MTTSPPDRPDNKTVSVAESPPGQSADGNAPPPPRWVSYLTLAMLVIYTLMLCWLAVDRVFDLGVFEPKRDTDPLEGFREPLIPGRDRP